MAAAANPVRGETVVSIAGTDFVLVPSFGRLAKIEAALGRSLIKFMGQLEIARDVRLEEVVTIIELLARDPKLKAEQIGALVVRAGVFHVLPDVARVLVRGLTGTDTEEPTDDDAGGKGPGDGPSAE